MTNPQLSCFDFRSVGDIEVADIPKARRTDPETSHQAGDSAIEMASSHRAQILALLRKVYPLTLTHSEIDDRLGWQHPTAARRMKELGDDVEAMGTRPTHTGRLGTAYRARVA